MGDEWEARRPTPRPRRYHMRRPAAGVCHADLWSAERPRGPGNRPDRWRDCRCAGRASMLGRRCRPEGRVPTAWPMTFPVRLPVSVQYPISWIELYPCDVKEPKQSTPLRAVVFSANRSPLTVICPPSRLKMPPPSPPGSAPQYKQPLPRRPDALALIVSYSSSAVPPLRMPPPLPPGPTTSEEVNSRRFHHRLHDRRSTYSCSQKAIPNCG